MKPTRRTILATPAVLLLPRSGIAPAGQASRELSDLMARRIEAGKRIGTTGAVADTLAFAIDRGEPQAIARLTELPGLREIAGTAAEALDAIDREIATLPARTLQDLAIKLRLFVDEQGYLDEPDSDEDGTASYEAQLLLSILRDLERMAGLRP